MAGGLIFLLVFAYGYSNIDRDLFEYRDDGLISLSSGRNLVDFGFLGVSPSGPIVETSSTPLQTFVYALAYWPTGIDYKTYCDLQTLVSTFVLGFLFARIFADRPLTALFLTVFTAFSLTRFYPFYLWHASGMENALTHLFFFATLFILHSQLRDEVVHYRWAPVVFLATVARIESVLQIGLLLVLFSIYWYVEHRSFKALRFSTLVFVLWASLQIWRFWYFGDALPNTAYAQGISVADRLAALTSGHIAVRRESWSLAQTIFVRNAGWVLLALWPILLMAGRHRGSRFLRSASLALVFTSLLMPFLFGTARIDPSRTTTQMALAIFLLIAASYHALEPRRSLVAVLAFTLPLVVLVNQRIGITPYNLGWNSAGFAELGRALERIAADHEIPRATVANSDLGIISWQKDFNIVDLGRLGDPNMARIEPGPALTRYFLDYAAPDIIEAHGYWLWIYCDSIFGRDEFRAMYEQLGDGPDISTDCSTPGDQVPTYWVRRAITRGSGSPERTLLDDLGLELSSKRVREELASCGDDSSCRYVARTAFKFIPELRASDRFNEVLALFESPTDRALLEGWRDSRAPGVIRDAILEESPPTSPG